MVNATFASLSLFTTHVFWYTNVAFTTFAQYLHFCDIFARSKFVQNHFFIPWIKVGTHQATSCSNTLRQQITPCVQVGWLVAATRWGDTSPQRQIASCVLENFCENLCLCDRILLLQQVAKNQIRLNLCDLLLRQNSVAATRIFTKFSTTHEATCCCNVSPRHVAATCRLVCTNLKPHTGQRNQQLCQGTYLIIVSLEFLIFFFKKRNFSLTLPLQFFNCFLVFSMAITNKIIIPRWRMTWKIKLRHFCDKNRRSNLRYLDKTVSWWY